MRCAQAFGNGGYNAYNFQILTSGKPRKRVFGYRLNYYVNFSAGLEFKENWILKMKIFHGEERGRDRDICFTASSLKLHEDSERRGTLSPSVSQKWTKKPTPDNTAWGTTATTQHRVSTTSLDLQQLNWHLHTVQLLLSFLSPLIFLYEKHRHKRKSYNGDRVKVKKIIRSPINILFRFGYLGNPPIADTESCPREDTGMF